MALVSPAKGDNSFENKDPGSMTVQAAPDKAAALVKQLENQGPQAPSSDKDRKPEPEKPDKDEAPKDGLERLRGSIAGWTAKLSNLRQNNLDDNTLEAARQEQQGAVVARKKGGSPFDHVEKVRSAMGKARGGGLLGMIEDMKGALKGLKSAGKERTEVEKLLAEAEYLVRRVRAYVSPST